MTKLNQLIAIEKGVKAGAQRTLTDAYHAIQKTPLLSGISRTYQPKDDDGDKLPPESTLVQVKVDEILDDVSVALTRLLDVVLTKDTTNRTAAADVVVDGDVLIKNAPVTYLLWLEKQLIDLHTFVAKLPTLDPADEWDFDAAAGVWRAKPVETTRTKKIPRNWVRADATKEHPAQVDVYHEDVIVGTWTTVKFSGAVPATRVGEILERVSKLTDAVKFAREEANGVDVADVHAGAKIFGYLFGS